MDLGLIIVYGAPLVLIMGWYAWRRRRHESRALAARSDAQAAGLLEPASLHPLIDAAKCVGCGACVRACPEQPEHHVLGLINGKAQLVSPTDCIGHGACRTACPVGAIKLVFGTETRGVDIPTLQPNFESNVPGIFVAGELGGMGLIRNALTQGRQAIEHIAKSRPRDPKKLDVLIVGGGPAGFAAALTAKSLGLHYLIVEQETLGGCVFKYPRGKLVMTSPVDVPLAGRMYFRQTSKEELLKFWNEVVEREQLLVNNNERVEAIKRDADGSFVVRSTKNHYRASSVLLAIGRRGSPRKLEVPGEDLPKVVYRLQDPEQYANQEVLIVGGGDSALEAAASIADVAGTRVTLSYRGDAFGRAKPRNRARVEQAASDGRMSVLLSSRVSEIHPDLVVLEKGGEKIEMRNGAIIVNAGGILPNEFLREVGIDVATKFGTE
jgi:thioredoxin reductase/ferredoxin